VRNILRKKWYPSVVQTFLNPPPDDNLQNLIISKQYVFKAAAVLMTRQLRGLVESTCSSLAEFFESFSPIPDSEISRAIAGKNEVKNMPAFYVKLVVSGNHIRIVPGLDEIDASLSSMLDHAVGACEGFPPLDPSCLPPYSPFSDLEGTEEENNVTVEQLQLDSVSITSQLFDGVEVSRLRMYVCMYVYKCIRMFIVFGRDCQLCVWFTAMVRL
jgi:hypothetical protein